MDSGELDLIRKRIKNRRIELNLSLEDVSKITGVSKSTVKRYEDKSIGKVPISYIVDLAKALNVSPAWIMGWDDTKILVVNNDFNDSETEIINDYRKLNDLGKKQAKNAVKSFTFNPEFNEKNVLSIS